MWSTCLMQLRSMFRDRQAVFWMIVFPVILTTLVHAVFGNFMSNVTLESQSVAVVRDDPWRKDRGAQAFMDALSSPSDDTASLVDPTYVDSYGQAVSALRKGDVVAIVQRADDGLSMAVSDDVAKSVQSAQFSGGDMQSWGLSALRALIGQYNQRIALIADVVDTVGRKSPDRLSDPAFMSALLGQDESVRATSVSSPLRLGQRDTNSRYMFVVIGLMAMMGMIMSVESMHALRSKESVSAMRIAASPLSRGGKVASLLLSTWLMGCITLLTVFLYVRHALGASTGGRDGLALVAIMVGSFVSQGLGLLLGSLPWMSLDVKRGIAIMVSMALSVTAGLQGSMDLADTIQRHAPWLHLVNPLKQVSVMFDDLLFRDSLSPFAATAGICVAMGLAGLAIAMCMMRKERHDYL